MDLPYSSEPGRFPQWHRLEAVLEGPETENWPELQLFLRLGIATDPSNRRLDRKSEGGLLQSGYFSLCRGGGEPLIAKKLQKRSDFCFCGRWIAAAGQILQKTDRRSGGGSRKGWTVAAGRIPEREGCRSGADLTKGWFSAKRRVRSHPFCYALCLRR